MRVKLSAGQVADHLQTVRGWSVVDGKVSKEFEFETYSEGVLFACAVAQLADRMDHHPDLTIGYRRVRVAVNTHDVSGISPLDFELARKIDSL